MEVYLYSLNKKIKGETLKNSVFYCEITWVVKDENATGTIVETVDWGDIYIDLLISAWDDLS